MIFFVTCSAQFYFLSLVLVKERGFCVGLIWMEIKKKWDWYITILRHLLCSVLKNIRCRLNILWHVSSHFAFLGWVFFKGFVYVVCVKKDFYFCFGKGVPVTCMNHVAFNFWILERLTILRRPSMNFLHKKKKKNFHTTYIFMVPLIYL